MQFIHDLEEVMVFLLHLDKSSICDIVEWDSFKLLALKFDSVFLMEVVPGIGMILSFFDIIHARETCAGVASKSIVGIFPRFCFAKSRKSKLLTIFLIFQSVVIVSFLS